MSKTRIIGVITLCAGGVGICQAALAASGISQVQKPIVAITEARVRTPEAERHASVLPDGHVVALRQNFSGPSRSNYNTSVRIYSPEGLLHERLFPNEPEPGLLGAGTDVAAGSDGTIYVVYQWRSRTRAGCSIMVMNSQLETVRELPMDMTPQALAVDGQRLYCSGWRRTGDRKGGTYGVHTYTKDGKWLTSLIEGSMPGDRIRIPTLSLALGGNKLFHTRPEQGRCRTLVYSIEATGTTSTAQITPDGISPSEETPAIQDAEWIDRAFDLSALETVLVTNRSQYPQAEREMRLVDRAFRPLGSITFHNPHFAWWAVGADAQHRIVICNGPVLEWIRVPAK